MKRLLLLIGLLVPSFSSAADLTGYWFGSGGYKMPRQDLYPTAPVSCTVGSGQSCPSLTTTYSSWTITRNWDGTTAQMFGGKNETVGGVLYLLNGSGSDATSVSVVISSLTGPSGSGIASVAVSSMNVWNTTTRPIQTFYVRYLPYRGRNVWYGQEYEARHDPQGGRRPCTVDVNNDCNPSGLWVDRPNHDKFLPDIMVPMELIAASSFTVAASSSQAIWFDVYVASSLAAGTYTGSITVSEGVVVSTIIPVSLLVYDFVLPDEPVFKSLVNMKAYDINYRHQNQHFPTTISCSTCVVTRDHYAQMFRAHGYSATSGQDVNMTVDYPSTEYEAHLDGSIYTPAQGYGNARGVGVGDNVYSIGTYSSWPSATWSSTVIDGATGFCTNISSWSAYFANNHPDVSAFVYLQDEPSDLTNVDKWSTWMSTVCAQPGYNLGSFVTASYTEVNADAPNVNTPATVLFYGPNGTGTSAAWAAVGSSYTSTTNSEAWYYNGLAPGTGNMFAHEEDGVSPQVTFWALYKKGIDGYFSWMGAYFTDTNNTNSGPTSNSNNDLFNDARTFGYSLTYAVFTVSGMSTTPTCHYTDAIAQDYQITATSLTGTAPNIQGTISSIAWDPSRYVQTTPTGTLTKVAGACTGDATITYSAYSSIAGDTVSGRKGINYANGDGVLVYPGTDLIIANPNYGFDGPIASWRLKMHRRGLTDMEYLHMADDVDASATTALVNSAVPSVLWDIECFNLADCSYFYGERSWSNSPDVWEDQREELAQIITGDGPAPPPTGLSGTIGGRAKISGRARIQ